MNFTRIDLNEWTRGELFKFYLDHMRIVMSLTVDIDVTALIAFIRKNDLKFYPSMLWIISKVVNDHDEFKYGWDDAGSLIKWDSISPSYVDFHQENQTFTKMVTPFCSDLFDFHAKFMYNRNQYQHIRGIAENQPPNFFDVSCLPWVKYKHFDMHVFDEGKFLAPVITWGKYEAEHKKQIMPLTMNIHHAVADGFHLARFFNEVQALINSF